MTAKQLKENLQWDYPEKITTLTIRRTGNTPHTGQFIVSTENVPDGDFNCVLVLEGNFTIFCRE